MGRDPLLGRGYLLLGRQKLCEDSVIVVLGYQNLCFCSFWVAKLCIFCFECRQLPNVENHCFRRLDKTRSEHSLVVVVVKTVKVFTVIKRWPQTKVFRHVVKFVDIAKENEASLYLFLLIELQMTLVIRQFVYRSER